jgi:hypothetical protein
MTHQKQGVYFEAGFAKGLGRKVVWSCRNDWLDKTHFDTRHLGHVVWENHEDLKEGLVNAIKAHIIPST